MLNLGQTKKHRQQQQKEHGKAATAAEKEADKDEIEEETPAAEEAAEPVKEEAKKEEPKRLTMDRTRPFAIIRGEPGVAYQQRGNYFDRKGKYVRGSAFRLTTPDKEAQPASTSRVVIHRSEGGKTTRMIAEVGAVPKTVKDAAKENAQAEAAENNTPVE